MRCAIYARKSTAQYIADTEKSVTLQIDTARRFIAQHQLGAAAEEFIVIDDGISGANFSTRALLPLVHAAKQTPRPFDVLVAMDVDRVGREQYRTNAAFLDLTEAGVRVYLHSDGGAELKLDTPLGKVMLGLRSFAAEEFRHAITVKTKLRMHHKAREGQVCGNKVYGYANVPVLDAAGRRSHVERRVREDQAQVVERIFQMAADGLGIDRIAKTLTAERVPPPRGDGRGWAPTCVHAMLRNDLYRGVLVYGRTERIYRGGKRSQRRRDPSQWLRREAPELRIIAEELWHRAHDVIATKAASFKRSGTGRLIGRPPGTRSSPYLLSGLSQCGVCEGSIFAYARNHHAGAPVGWYRCHLHATRGADICTNKVWVPMQAVDTLVLDAIERQVLDAAALDACLDEAVKRWEAEQTPAAAARAAVKTELRRVETEIAALEHQLVRGAPWELIAEPMVKWKQRRDTLRADVAQADTREEAVAHLAGPALRAELSKRLGDWRGLAARQPEDARQLLMRLLDGRRIVFRPLGKGKGCEITGEANYTPILEAGGIRWWPQRELAVRRVCSEPPSRGSPSLVGAGCA